MHRYTNNIFGDVSSVPPTEIVKRNNLLNHQSLPARKMEERLRENGIEFEKEFIILTILDNQFLYQNLDFFIPSLNFAIEIDGGQHRDHQNIRQMNLDDYKNKWCLHYSIRLIRICSHLLNHNGNSLNTIEMIKWSRILSDKQNTFNHMQYGSGFGQSVADYWL